MSDEPQPTPATPPNIAFHLLEMIKAAGITPTPGTDYEAVCKAAVSKITRIRQAHEDVVCHIEATQDMLSYVTEKSIKRRGGLSVLTDVQRARLNLDKAIKALNA